MGRKIISLILVLSLLSIQAGLAEVGQLNLANYLSQGPKTFTPLGFQPPVLRYFSYDAGQDNFQLLLDPQDLKDKLSEDQTKSLAQEQLNYFMVGLTLPNSKFWVNLRPDAPENIIEPELEQTEVGRIMLESDLQLKKDTALFTSPQTKEGRVYWDKLYEKAKELFGTEPANIPTITRPWIVPGEILIREDQGAASTERSRSAYVYKATLKVMLEEDYLERTENRLQRTENRAPNTEKRTPSFKDPRMKELNTYSSQLIRELILPKLTQEVNSGKNYASLRQVYFSLVLSRWFKARFRSQRTEEHLPVGRQGEQRTEQANLSQLIDRSDLTGLTSKTPWSKTTYFKEYQKSFAQGEYNLKEQVATPTGQVIRSYVSGGMNMVKIDSATFSTQQPTATVAGSPIDIGSQLLDMLVDGWPYIIIAYGIGAVTTDIMDYFDNKKNFVPRKIVLGSLEIPAKLQEKGLNFYWMQKFVEKNKDLKVASVKIGKYTIYVGIHADVTDKNNPVYIISLKYPEEGSYEVLRLAKGNIEVKIDYLEWLRPQYTRVLSTLYTQVGLVEILEKLSKDYNVLPLLTSSPLTLKKLKKELQDTITNAINGLTELDVEMGDKLHRITVENMGKYAEVDNPDDLNSLLVATIKKIDEWADKKEEEIKPKLNMNNSKALKSANALTNSVRPFIERLTNIRLRFVSISELPSIPVEQQHEGNMPRTMDDGGYGERVPTSMDEGMDGTADSALTREVGGIDFTDIEKYLQYDGNFKGLDLSLPLLSKKELESLDLEKEEETLRNYLATGYNPNGDRLKRLLAGLFQKEEFSSQQLDLLRLSQNLCNFLSAMGKDLSPDQRAFILIADTGLFLKQGQAKASIKVSLN